MNRVVIALAGVCIAVSAFARQPPRDPRQAPRGAQPPDTGGVRLQADRDPQEPPNAAAAITGVVLSDERPPKPLRRARVALNSSELSVGRTVITSDDGSFAFEPVAPGSYTLAAAKDGYVALNYGAKRPGRPGTSVVARRGERRRVRFILTRGSVITGTVTLPDGQPAAGIGVTALAYRYAAGERVPLSAGVAAASTDDRGVYRIFGLPAGEHIVAAQVGTRDSDDGEPQVISEAEIRRALVEVRDPFARPQSRTPDGIVAPAPITLEPPRVVRFAPIYYPGTAVMNNATFVTLGPSEERRGVDFELQYVPAATVSGTLFTTGGMQPLQIVLTAAGDGRAAAVTRTTVANPDGRFTFNDVAPGEYALMTRLIAPGARTSGSVSGTPADVLWASADVFVNGQDVMDIVLTLQTALTITGRVAFEGASPPPRLAGLRVSLPAILRSGGIAVPQPSLRLEPDGRFTISGIIPGVHRLGPFMQGQRAPIGPWWLKSIVVSGREILDTPLELRQSADDAVVTFSDRATELRGTLTDASGNPAPNNFVVVFGVDPTSWFFNSRRVAGVRPDADGRYAIRNLPPGEYFVAAFDDLEPGEWYDPVVLQRLAIGATRVTLVDAEKKNLSVRVSAGQ